MDDAGASRLQAASFPMRLRPHQAAAIAAHRGADDPDRCHLVLPPGSGKTLIGAEIARQAGRPILVLTPNTAIQGQWSQVFRTLQPPLPPGAVREDRSLEGEVTVLTYQAIATFDDDDPATDDPPSGGAAGAAGALSQRLHPDAALMLDRLADGPPFTLILDEAHHLAQTWGQLLAELLGRLHRGAPPIVVALTATPRSRLTPEQAELTDDLFGPVLFTIATPALVRDSVLAPFRELVRFVEPSEAEQQYLTESATRWQELIASLLDPQFAARGFLPYLDTTWIARPAEPGGGAAVSWSYVERKHPDIARAILRLHAGLDLVALPEGARLREEHRQPPATEDWVALIADYGRNALVESPDPRDQEAWQRLRTALRAVAWTLTRTGARRGQSPVDKVLQRTVVKADAAAQIVHHESQIRGPALRAVVITDFERATATPSADLRAVLAPQAGSAWEALARIQQTSPDLAPVLVTGAVVAASPATLTRFRDSLAGSAPDLAGGLLLVQVPDQPDFAELTGPGWSPRRWVPAVTAWFLAGETRALIGTRGLLGEGWDAAGITTLIDLTAATTTTSVVQVRGRAIRRDPEDPDKAAHIWSVVAVSDSHPRGDLDYRRFVAKHDGFHAADPGGHIVLGVGHVSARCGPFHPPDVVERERINADMLSAAERTAQLRQLWGVGQPYAGVDAPVLRIGGQRQAAPRLDAPEVAVRRWESVRGLFPAGVAAVGAGAPLALGAAPLAIVAGAAAGAAAGWAADAGLRRRSTRRALEELGPDDTLLAIGRAVAMALGDRLVASVEVAPDPDGLWRVQLQAPGAEPRASFATALDQVLAPIDWPRYLVSRLLPERRAEMWHAVPDFAGHNKQAAQRFQDAWQQYVSKGRLVYTGSPVGAGLLAAVRGLNPLDVTTAVRVEWR